MWLFVAGNSFLRAFTGSFAAMQRIEARDERGRDLKVILFTRREIITNIVPFWNASPIVNSRSGWYQSSMTSILFGCVVGFVAWFLVRYLAAGLFTVNQNERAVKTSFGRAERFGNATTLEDPIAASLSAEERERYAYPQVRVIPPGGPYFKWPWEN